MAVSIDDVKKIATLSKLRYDDAELDSFVSQFQEILDYFAQLSSAPTDDVRPTYHALEGVSGTPFRLDQAQPSLSSEAAVSNAPEEADRQFRVPKVIE